MKGQLGVVAALSAEARAFSRGGRGGQHLRPDDARRTRLLVSGIGHRRALAAARELVTQGVGALCVFGVAGGLDPDLAPGVVMLPELVCDDRGHEVETSTGWRALLAEVLEGRVPTHAGMLLQVSAVLADPGAKRALRERTGAAAVDMESAAVGAVAQEAGLPFLAVRVVCDSAAQRIPASALEATDERGRPQLGRLVRCLARRPFDVLGLLSMGRSFSLARGRLAQVVRIAGPDFSLARWA